ncbi:MAG: RNA polymerase factor sigma-54 [Verrucomicrobiales bacterium]|nr:RNA polymerase factor sigma-54 [Verrucomicrobiales bacterium]
MPDQGLYQTQTQKLAIGPQMQQSLQILQAPTLELRQIIQTELETNPVLEVETPDVPLEEALPSDPDASDEWDSPSAMEDEWKDYWSQSRLTDPHRRADDQERWQYMMDSITAPITLQEHLISQLRTAGIENPRLVEDVEFLIGNLGDDGLLHTRLEDLSFMHAVPIDELAAAKDLLQSFDPVGVGAEDLRECLLIQLERMGRKHSLAYRLVDQFLEDLAHRRYPVIARKLGVPVDQISRAADLISTLDPRPAQAFSVNTNAYVNPDVLVEKQGNEWIAVMNGDDLPALRISHAYKDMLGQNVARGDVGHFIREKIRSGKFLIRSIQQRQQTIQKIATEIIHHQREFLEQGSAHLRPLNMATVAEAVGVHETTVSRAIAGKFIRTPHGVFELKFFFSHGVRTDSGEDVSNNSVKNAIAELVKQESKTRPLSDDKLAKLLAEQGIQVARRTVAKYRESLGILPSHLRKSFS